MGMTTPPGYPNRTSTPSFFRASMSISPPVMVGMVVSLSFQYRALVRGQNEAGIPAQRAVVDAGFAGFPLLAPLVKFRLRYFYFQFPFGNVQRHDVVVLQEGN